MKKLILLLLISFTVGIHAQTFNARCTIMIIDQVGQAGQTTVNNDLFITLTKNTIEIRNRQDKLVSFGKEKTMIGCSFKLVSSPYRDKIGWTTYDATDYFDVPMKIRISDAQNNAVWLEVDRADVGVKWSFRAEF